MTNNRMTIQDRILNTAETLFNHYGYCAVGVDRVSNEAEVSKATMYKYFQSKEGLIEQVLLRRDAHFRQALMAQVEESQTPWEKIDAIIQWHVKWFHSPQFSGCMFIAAKNEFLHANQRIVTIVQNHKMWLRSFIESCLDNEKSDYDRTQQAQMIFIFIEGIISYALLYGTIDYSIPDPNTLRRFIGS